MAYRLVERINLALGNARPVALDPIYTAAQQDRILAILGQLDEIDGALHQAALDSMAVKVDTLTLDYGGHGATLRNRGSELLRELSRLSGIPVVADRYTGTGLDDQPRGGAGAVLSIQNLL
jgi:hypothetical protein